MNQTGGPPPGQILPNPADACDWQRPSDPCSIVIFGASGDLTRRKLIPALYDLFLHNFLPERFAVVGAARTDLSDQAFRDLAREGVAQTGADLSRWEDFAAGLFYQPLIYDLGQSYLGLAQRLAEVDRARNLSGCRIFNLAVPPALYGQVALGLFEAGLSREEPERGVWTRLVVEKPFGYDLASARELNATIAQGFAEHQVFRIDHYMAKETVQNIFVLRFANAIFEPLWNRNYIDYVRINASESLGIEHRAGYYEQSGVLRDMFQNHMMQLLALVACEPPARLEPELVRDKNSELFRSLKPFSPTGLGSRLVLGQYTAGEVGGQPVVGYRQEPGVDLNSQTPTYAMMRVEVDNWRWQGVPFYLTSGKRLRRKVTRVDIQFKKVPHSLFRDIAGVDISANRLILGIYPEEVVFLAFQAKQPGPSFCLRTTGLQFSYGQGAAGPKLNAYAKGLADAMAGDQMLFWRQDGLELCWQFLEPVLAGCEACRDMPDGLRPYPAGSHGPDQAIDLLPRGAWPEKP